MSHSSEDNDDSMVSNSYPPIESNDPDNAPQSDARQVISRGVLAQCLACLAATMGGLVVGGTLGWSGPALSLINGTQVAALNSNEAEPQIRLDEGTFSPLRLLSLESLSSIVITPTEANFIASLVPLGALIGGPVSSALLSWFGRRSTMIGTSAGFALGYIFLTAGWQAWMLLVGRIIAGLMCGFTTVAAPIYVAETANKDLRGRLGSMYQLMITLGIFYIDAVGLCREWRWLGAAIIIACLIWSVLLLMVPESPSYLLEQRRYGDARRALQFLRAQENVESELEELSTTADNALQQNQTNTSILRKLMQPVTSKALIIAILLMFGQQMSGVNAVIFFSVSIFESAGTHMNSFVESLLVALVQVIGTVVAILFVDRSGRKPLLITSGVVMALTTMALGIYFYLLSSSPDTAASITFIPLTSLCLFILAFAVGFGPVPWLMMAELFAQEVREPATAITACSNWMFAFLVTQFFSPLVSLIGAGMTFGIFAICTAIVSALVGWIVPETKGRSLQEIQDLIRGNREPSDDRRELLDDAGPVPV